MGGAGGLSLWRASVWVEQLVCLVGWSPAQEEDLTSNLCTGVANQSSEAVTTIQVARRGATLDYTLRFDAKHRVLLITLAGGHVLTEAAILDIRAAALRFVDAQGPCSVITDASLVE
jgi:hypothetical protein